MTAIAKVLFDAGPRAGRNTKVIALAFIASLLMVVGWTALQTRDPSVIGSLVEGASGAPTTVVQNG